MLGSLIKKEILEHLMSLRFAIACVLCLVVILCSVFVRARDFVQVLDDQRQETKMANQWLDDLREPWALGWSGRPIAVPRLANPMKVFVRGVRSDNGGAVNVSTRTRLEPSYRPVSSPAVVLFPPIDLVTFVGVILSLMALVFGYDAVCGEKERGTLRLMLSYSVPRRTVLLAKWIGGYVTLIVPFLLAAAVGIVVVMIQPDVSLDGGQWARLGAILGLATVYVAAVYSLAVYVSVLTRKAATSVMVLLSLWVVLVLVVPNLAPHASGVLHPIPTAGEMEKQREAARKEIDQRTRALTKAWDEQNGFGDKWWEGFPWGKWPEMERVYARWIFQTDMNSKARAETFEAWERIDAPRRRQLDQQVTLTRWIGRVSPFSCFAYASTELADAGVLYDRRLDDQLRAYQRDLTAYAWRECLFMEHKGLEARDKDYPDWRKVREAGIPRFAYVPPAAGDYLRVAAIDGGILAGMAVLFFFLATVTFLRYDVR